MSYLIGNAVTISTSITDANSTPVDPSTITLVITKPDNTTDTFTGGQLTHGGTGQYGLVYLPAAAGRYLYVWTTTVPSSASDGTFSVDQAGYSLVTASEIRKHLNLTDTTEDVELEGFSRAAQAVIENITGPIVPKTVTDVFDGGKPTIVLTEYPVLSIASVTENSSGTAYTLAEITAPYNDTSGYSYRVDYSIGALTRWSGNVATRWAAGSGTVTVVYTAGRAEVPADIRLATLRLIEHLWMSQQKSGRPGGPPQDVPGAAHALPWFVEELLEPHRKAPVVA